MYADCSGLSENLFSNLEICFAVLHIAVFRKILKKLIDYLLGDNLLFDVR